MQSKSKIQNWSNSDQSEKEFQGVHADREEICNAQFQECVFQSSSFIESTFKNCEFEDCIFKNCDLSLIKSVATSYVNCKFMSSKCVGIDWTKTNIAFSLDISFEESTLNSSVFYGLDLQNISILHCLAKEVNFEESNLTSAKLIGTDFSKSRFQHTNLTKADFSQAKNY